MTLKSKHGMKTTLHIRHMKNLLLALTGMAALMACQPKDVLQEQVVAYDTIRLLISCPQAPMQPRFGDPGSAVPETADWDQMSILFVYTDDSNITPVVPGSQVIVNNISKDEYDKLDSVPEEIGKFKELRLKVQIGKAYIYGVTYSTAAADNPIADINACKTKDDVEALTISNDYAGSDMNKFVSVATGYYKGTGTGTTPAIYDIAKGGTGVNMPTMTLTRLAAKIDIQWDAVDAYGAGYTDVKVTGFSFLGTEKGYLFPELNTTAQQGKSWDFYNTSAISQRNGRVYHYTFPDGVSKPSITFDITAKDKDNNLIENTGNNNNGYKMNFDNPLQRATWYKINTTIKGVTGTTDMTEIPITN